MLCTFLRSFCKNAKGDVGVNIDVDELFNKFEEDQEYYLKVNASRFPFLTDYLYDDTFIAETKEYIKACLKYYNYKESQAPLIQKQKEFDKKKRKFLQEVKMSKEPPTKKQLYYYERLCKKYNIEMKNTDELSKLDMRNEIERIIDEHSGNSINSDISRD